MQEKLLRPKEAAAFLGVGISKLWRLAKDPNFPQKMRLGEKSVGWWMSDLKQYVIDLNKEEVA